MISDINKNGTYCSESAFKDISKSILILAAMMPIVFSSQKEMQRNISQIPMGIFAYSKFNNCNSSNYEIFDDFGAVPTFCIDKFAEDVFGKMRNATEEENEYVYNAMISTAKMTGVNILDL